MSKRMSLVDLLSRETFQLVVVVGIAMFFHYYFIRQRISDFYTSPLTEFDRKQEDAMLG